MGSLLKYRRKKMLEKKTANLKRASNIWDLGDSAGGSLNAVDKANEKAASDLGGAAPFAAPPGHSRQDSASSSESGSGSLVRSDIMPPRPMPANFQQQPNRYRPDNHRGWANRVSRAFMTMRPAPAPPLPLQGGRLVGQSAMQNPNEYYGNMRRPHDDMQHQDSFGTRAHPPPRNAFFPPSPPQQEGGSRLGVSPPDYSADHPLGVTPPLALPGMRR